MRAYGAGLERAYGASARAYYDTRRANGDGHYKALRALGNRLVDILHGYVCHHTTYDEATAWGQRANTAA